MTQQAPTFTAPDESCYVQINGFTIYIEVSEATRSIPYVSYYEKEKDDNVMHWLTGITEKAQ